jgi:hypothetical protein
MSLRVKRAAQERVCVYDPESRLFLGPDDTFTPTPQKSWPPEARSDMEDSPWLHKLGWKILTLSQAEQLLSLEEKHDQ